MVVVLINVDASQPSGTYNVTFNYAPSTSVSVAELKQGICDQMDVCGAGRLKLSMKGRELLDADRVETGAAVIYTAATAGPALCRARQIGESCTSSCGASCYANNDLKCCNGVCLSARDKPSKSCFADVSWPSCTPSYAVSFGKNPWRPECGTPSAESGMCCLSKPTPDRAKHNCPTGWSSNPNNAAEWCTDSMNLFSSKPRLYRHKCERSPKCTMK